MHEKTKPVQVRFATSQNLLAARTGHKVRTITERTICEWLTAKGIAHRHAGEVYIVKGGARGSPSLFVPDIVLSETTARGGKTIIIETLHSFSPKRGGLRVFAAFCKQYHDQFYSILVARKANLESVPRRTCDAQVALEDLDALEKKLSRLIAPR
jgi:hypothetical protein